MEKKRVAPYDVSMKLNERLSDISQRLTDIVMHSKEMTMKDVIPIANKLLYETAQQQNMNLWNLCMMVAPDFEYATKLIDGKVKMVCEVKLVPLEFDYTHSPDYWEEKYKELKSKLQDLIFKENE